MEGGSSLAYLGSLIGLFAFLKAVIPDEALEYMSALFLRFISWSSTRTNITISEFTGLSTNELYELVDLHVATLTDRSCPKNLELSRVKDTAKPRYALGDKESIVEVFGGVAFTWIHHLEPRKGDFNHWKYSEVRRSYTLVVHKSFRSTVLPEYLDHVIGHAEELKHKNKKRMLYTNFRGDDWESRKRPWRPVPFDHPATFDSMAMDPETKDRLKKDLLAFMSGEKYFRKIGRAWKRGYLLYGPPGTGKSSLIAAIADFTGYDIYDLELTEVKSNSELRKYLAAITKKAIVVIEDIDCSMKLKKRGKAAPDKPSKKDDEDEENEDDDDEESRVTLSGLLNFTDGLWSCVGSERIIIFTTNHIEELDPALIRTGRMDLHICLSYCTFEAFKVLARTHLELQDHELFLEIQRLLAEVEITPADVAEVLIQNRSEATVALEYLVGALTSRKTAVATDSTAEIQKL